MVILCVCVCVEGGVGKMTNSSVTFITAGIEQIYGDCVCVGGGGGVGKMFSFYKISVRMVEINNIETLYDLVEKGIMY